MEKNPVTVLSTTCPYIITQIESTLCPLCNCTDKLTGFQYLARRIALNMVRKDKYR